MGKMTNKEFIQAFNDAGFNFEVWGYEGILNMVSILAKYQSNEALMRGCPIVAKAEQDRHDKIYEILYKRGYYDK